MKFKELFEENHTIKDTKVKISLKPDIKPVQQKAPPIPFHLQNSVEKEINRLIKSGHLEKLDKAQEDTFISPVVITVRKGQIGQNRIGFKKIKRSVHKTTSTHAEHGRPNKPYFNGNFKERH